MREIIKNALNEAWKNSQNVSTITVIEKQRDVSGMQLFELTDFIESNNIPLDAFLCGDEYSNGALLCWSVDKEATLKEIEKRRIYRFNRVQAFPFVAKALLASGYKRIGLDFIEYKKFGAYDLYELYLADNYDRLEQYFSLYFKKE